MCIILIASNLKLGNEKYEMLSIVNLNVGLKVTKSATHFKHLKIWVIFIVNTFLTLFIYIF